MTTLGNTFKVCATCAYYECQRRPKGRTFVEFESGCDGKCYCRFPQGISRNPMASCPDWCIWPPIKG